MDKADNGAAAPGGQLPAQPSNPYYPPGVVVPNYVPNTTALWLLFAYFSSALYIYLTAAVFLAGRVRPKFRAAPLSDKALFVWFTLCGGLHCFFEGYFVTHYATLAGSQAVPAQLWKEYALADSRYVTSDPFMMCVEGITALVYGPLCLVAAASIVYGAGLPAGSAGLRYILQIVISTAHLYGVALYYTTVILEETLHGISYCRPEFVYVWVYFAGMNAPWVVVPAIILYTSIKKVCLVFSTVNKININEPDVGGRQTTGKKMQ